MYSALIYSINDILLEWPTRMYTQFNIPTCTQSSRKHQLSQKKNSQIHRMKGHKKHKKFEGPVWNQDQEEFGPRQDQDHEDHEARPGPLLPCTTRRTVFINGFPLSFHSDGWCRHFSLHWERGRGEDWLVGMRMKIWCAVDLKRTL